MLISEIFYSLQGEGLYSGEPTVFVRLQGCNLLSSGCSFCDTKYAQDTTLGKEMSVEDIVSEVSRLQPQYKTWVCITGGEPLWQEDQLHKLVMKLKEGGYRITIETNGSIKPPRWYTIVDSWNADIKCPSSGVCGVSKEAWFNTRVYDQVKFVVDDIKDLEFAKGIMDKHKADSPIIEISPVMREELSYTKLAQPWLQEVAEFCKENKVHLSLQLHKIIWGNKKGV